MDTVKIGIIGCGQFSAYHIRALSRFPDVRITAVCSRNSANSQERVQLIQEICPPPDDEPVAVYTDYADIVHHPNLDAVTVCTPPPVHAGPAIAAANAGKHVFCEGPMAVDLGQCDAMIAAARTNGIRFTVQHTNRFNQNAQMAKKALSDRLLGKVIMAKMDFLAPGAGDAASKLFADSWQATWKGSGGGAVFHSARYAVDTLMWLLGDACEVYAKMESFSEGIEVEDCAVATVRFCSGALGQIFISRLAPPDMLPSPFYQIDILGAKAAIEVLPDWSVNSHDNAYARDVNEKLSSQKLGPVGGWESQLRDWVDAIKEKREPCFPVESFRSQVEMTRALYQSVASGKPVSLPLKPDDPYYSGPFETT